MLKLMQETATSQTEDLALLESILWKGKPTCPYCRQRFSTPIRKEKRHHCNHCNTAFSATTRTIFHKTRIPLSKWIKAISIIVQTPAISVRELAIVLPVNKNTANRIIRQFYSQSPSQQELLIKLSKEFYERSDS